MPRSKNETRRKDILQAAYECFTQYGYAKSSLDVVAKQTGISRPLIYLHFKNKEDLFAAMLEDLFEEKYALAQKCLDYQLPKEDKLLHFVEILILKDWPMIANSFHGVDLFSELFRILPKFEAKYRKKFIQMATTVLADEDLAEVFRFSLTGMTSDNPTLNILRKRVKILIHCICK